MVFQMHQVLRDLRFIVIAISLCLAGGCYEPPVPEEVELWEIDEMVLDKPTVATAETEATADRDSEELVSAEDAGSPLGSPTQSSASGSANKEVRISKVNERAWIADGAFPWRADYMHYQQGRQVGFSQVDVERPRNQLKISRRDWTLAPSGEPGKYVWVSYSLEADETVEGKLSKFTLVRNGITDRETQEGRLQGDSLSVHSKVERVDADELNTSASVAWKQGTWGALGIQSLLMRDLMLPGEKRVALVFIPGLNQIAEVQMIAGNVEMTPLAGGQAPQLLPVDIQIFTNLGSSEPMGTLSRNWLNDKGEIEKTMELAGGRVTTFRVTRPTTERLAAGVRMTTFLESSIQLSLPIGVSWDDASPNDCVYNIKMQGADPATVFRKTTVQQVRSLDARTANVTVRPSGYAVSAGDTAAKVELEPTAQELATNAWVRSDHALIKDFANELVPADAAPGDVVRLLTTGLAERLELTELDSSEPDALNTLNLGSGDCFDHATLLTGLLRARGVPARLAIGLKVTNPIAPKLVCWVWSEAWVDGRWLGLDATNGQPIGRGYLTIERDSLKDDNPYLKILEVMQRIKAIESVTPKE